MQPTQKTRYTQFYTEATLALWLEKYKLTHHPLTALMKSVEFISIPEHELFITVLTLENGHVEVAESRPINPAEYVEAIGLVAAYRNAREALWPKIAYAARVTNDLEISTRLRAALPTPHPTYYVCGVNGVEGSDECVRVPDNIATFWSIYKQRADGREAVIGDYETRALADAALAIINE